jgi:hypothetical protein
MKKLTYLAGFLLLTTVLFFAACSTSEDNPDLPPTISFVAGDTLISGDATVPVGSIFSIEVLCKPNTTSGSVIKTLRVTRITNNQMISDNTYNATTTPFDATITFQALQDPTIENIEFTTTDKDGQSASISLQITTEETSGGAIDSFTMKVLGSYSSTTGSSFASINGDVYTMQEAYNNQPIIDFLYWWGGSTDATVGAPDDANAQLVFTGTYGLQNWTVAKNATRFKLTTLTAAEFDAVTDATPCIDNASGADQTRIPNLVIGQVFGFLSVTGKHGLIKVDAINPEAAGDITIDVKVEK